MRDLLVGPSTESLSEVLEILNGAAARKVKLGWWNDVMEEYPRRKYL